MVKSATCGGGDNDWCVLSVPIQVVPFFAECSINIFLRQQSQFPPPPQVLCFVVTGRSMGLSSSVIRDTIVDLDRG